MSAQFIGVDVGGTKISVAGLRDGQLDEPRITPTDTSSPDALIDEIVEQIQVCREPDAAAVGIGVPSIVDFATGRIKSSVNIPLRDVELRSVLRERLGLPVFVDNDATCAALCEAYDGDRLIVRNIVMITLGTGVGGGLVLGGRIYRGATGAAAELGHTLIAARVEEGAPPSHAFPQPGSLESLASGRALDGLAAAVAKEHPDSSIGRLAAATDQRLGQEVVEAAPHDEGARKLIELVGQRLGIGIANAINTFDPDLVVIGGGLANAGEFLLRPARETAQRFVVPGVGDRTEIQLARHGPEAGVRGAALLALQELAIERNPGTDPVERASRT